MPPLTEEQVRQIIRDELRNFMTSDVYLFGRNVRFDDGINIELPTITGTKLGTAIGQKLGLWGVTPVIQYVPSGASGYSAVGGTNVESDDVWTGGVGSQIYSVGDLVAALKKAGVILS